MKAEVGAEEFESEESKKSKFQGHGVELWGIGYVSSDHEQDDDEEDEEDPDEAVQYEDIRRRIFKGEIELDMEEFETISSNTRLRDIYNYRWWSDTDQDNYFILVNKHGRTLKPGE